MLLREAIRRLLEDPADVILANQILGTADVETIAARVEARVGPVERCRQFTQSVGAVFVLELAGGREVVLKIHAFSERHGGVASLAELEASYAAQAELVAAGIPCAPVLEPPRPFGDRAAAVMAVLATPPADDPHDPAVGRALAGMLARIAEVGATLRARPRPAVLPATVFAPPHNALFDFTRPGGEWIDARARAARLILDEPVPLIAMHTDFSCANVVVSGGRVAAIFDADSVCVTDELRCLASAAVHYTYTGETWTWPSRDEARAFVAAYRPLDRAEWRRLDAAAIYALAYTARCEFSLGGGPMLDRLAAAPDAYLSG